MYPKVRPRDWTVYVPLIFLYIGMGLGVLFSIIMPIIDIKFIFVIGIFALIYFLFARSAIYSLHNQIHPDPYADREKGKFFSLNPFARPSQFALYTALFIVYLGLILDIVDVFDEVVVQGPSHFIIDIIILIFHYLIFSRPLLYCLHKEYDKY